MRKIQVWAICNWGVIIKSGFSTSTDAYNYMILHNIDGAVARVWI